MTPGMKTSEFIMALVPVLIGVGLLIFGAVKGNEALTNLGQWLLLGGAGTYGVSRGLAKFGTGNLPVIDAPPVVEAPKTDAAAAAVVAKL